MRPRIGITTSNRPPEGVWRRAASVNLTYVHAIFAAGGLPVLLPNLPPEDAAEALAGLDGLLLSGGGDLDPACWNEPPHPASNPPDAERDAFELEAARAALARDLPLLGICRGVQVLAVATGGDLWQDIPDQCAGALAHRQTLPRPAPSHDVAVTAGSLLARVLAPVGDAGAHLHLRVNSFHHQAPRHPGTIFTTVATAPDGLIEGLCATGARFALGVQWHPEEMAATDPVQARLFTALVRAAAGARP
ncbi:MAG TPA: gamma-glutamyl-gamma-aminobutyrate hydrolase family protein [Armatimonadota bacterium]|nr:gamma-glutamyl-gamma-aminobutyrate hydrolase family protein [Armatimonadota bacterium]